MVKNVANTLERNICDLNPGTKIAAIECRAKMECEKSQVLNVKKLHKFKSRERVSNQK